MTVADQIGAYLRTQLEKIRLGNAVTLFGGQEYLFQTDAGQQVDKNLEYNEHPDAMPSMVFYTGKNSTITDDTVELGMEKHSQEFSVEGFIQCDKAGTEGDQLRQDLAAALKCDPWWGGLIDGLQGIETDIAILVGDDVYVVVKFSAQALYTVPFGSE